MHKINPLINNIRFEGNKRQKQKQSFGNYFVQNYAPAPIYTQVPYGIQQRNYIKLGVDKLPNGQEVHLYRLINGQNVQIIKKEGGTSVYTCVNVGAFDEKGYPKGIAHFIEHSVFHGSKSCNKDLMKELDKITTFDNASTSSKDTKYYMDLASDSIEALDQALDLQSGMLLQPTFGNIEKEKPIVQAEYQRDMLDDFNLMYENLLKNLFGFSDTNEASISGNDETIASITKEDMARFHSNFYRPSNMTTMITSKHNPDEIINLVARNFIGKSPKDYKPVIRQPISTIEKTTRTDIITNNLSDGNVYISFICPNLTNNFEILKLEALCSLFASNYLDSRMNFNMQSSSIGLISIGEHLNEDWQPNESIQNLYQKIIDFCSKPPSEEEVKEIKKELLKALDSSLNGGNITVMENISDNMNEGSNYLTYEAYKEMIESLTPQNIYEMTRYLNLNKAAIVVSHPKTATLESIKENNEQYPWQEMPINLAGNITRINYPFLQHQSQSTGDKFYSTTLQDGSVVYFINSPDENCEIEWRLRSEENYSSNPASKFVLEYLLTQKFMGSAFYLTQDEISLFANCEPKDLGEEINKMKSFTHLELSQKNLEDAKKDALKEIEDMESSTFEQFCESIFGSKFTTSKEVLKAQVEKLSLNDIVRDLNGMVLNSQSSYVVKAPIANNPNLAQDIANMLNTSNMQFNKQSGNKTLKTNTDFSNCTITINNASQNKIAQGYSFTIGENPKDYFIFNLLSKVLAGKNHNTVRERLGLAYYSGAQFKQKGNQGIIILNTEASCNNDGDLKKIYAQYDTNITELMNGQITEDELLLAKNKLKGYLKNCFNDKNEEMCEMFQNFAFKPHMINSLNNSDNIIDSITIEDIRNAANYAFNNKSQKILIAKQSMLDKNTDYINSLGSIEKR